MDAFVDEEEGLSGVRSCELCKGTAADQEGLMATTWDLKTRQVVIIVYPQQQPLSSTLAHPYLLIA